jgi:hypothetical protein
MAVFKPHVNNIVLSLTDFGVHYARKSVISEFKLSHHTFHSYLTFSHVQ